MYSLKNKKVLVMGLGALGGGVATTKWLVGQGAKVTVTDLKTREELAPSIKALGLAAKKTRFVLGKHDEKDFRTHDYIVVNPGVPKESPYLKIAKKARLRPAKAGLRPASPELQRGERGKVRIINDAVLFFEYLPKENPIIAVTGTRGKTTTTNWIAHFLKTRFPHVRAAGNTPENPLLKELERIGALPEWIPDQVRNDNGDKYHTPVVLELSSWQLEYLPEAKPASVRQLADFGPLRQSSSEASEARRAPDIAIITNLYPDHMNRYTSMKEYAKAKANIFKNQTKKQALILNKDNEWTKWFLRQKPISHIRYTSSSEVSEGVEGEHNIQNLQAASLAAHCMGISWEDIRARISSLPTARFRQEVVYEKNGLCIINDSASTSPEAGIAALRRFSLEAKRRGVPFLFIAGGTDKGLSYKGWAKEVARVKPILFLLEGSSTEKMKVEISRYRDIGISGCRDVVGYKDLKTIMQEAAKKTHTSGGVVVFSPSAASFEKFKNEFDRGEKFNELVKKYFMV